MDRQQLADMLTTNTAKTTMAAPAVSGTMYSLSDLPWAAMAGAATFIYTALLILFLLIDRYRSWKGRRQRRAYFRRKFKGKRNEKPQG